MDLIALAFITLFCCSSGYAAGRMHNEYRYRKGYRNGYSDGAQHKFTLAIFQHERMFHKGLHRDVPQLAERTTGKRAEPLTTVRARQAA